MDGHLRLTYTGLESHGIHIVPPSSEVFEETVKARIDENSLAALKPVLPYSLLIQNGSGRPISALEIVYSLKNHEGAPITARVASGGGGKYLFLSGALAFFSPVGGALLSDAPAKTKLHNAAFPPNRQQLFDTQIGIAVALAAVAFEDGTVIGPEASTYVDGANASFEAREDLHNQLANANTSKLRRTILEEIIAVGCADHHDRYANTRYSSAVFLLEEMKAVGEDLFGESLKRRIALWQPRRLRTAL